LITLINARSKDSQCKNNSNREQVVRNYTKKGRTSNIPSIFNFNPFVNKCFIICFTIFSILLPIGIQPQLESNYAFAEIDSQMTNDEIEYSDDENSSLSSTSESKSNLNVKNPFGSTGDNNKKENMNTIIPDIVEPDLPGTQPGSTTNSDETGIHHSIKEDHPNSVDNSISNTDNADGSIIVEKEGKPTATDLSSTDSQLGTLKNNEDKNVNDTNSLVSIDKPSTEILQSELSSQPKYKSYRDYVNNNSNNRQSVIESDDKPDTVLSSTDAQINTAYSNASNNTNGKGNETVTVLEDQSAITQSDSATSSESQSQSEAQPKYKSYRDFIKNSTSNSDDNINVTDDTQGTLINSTHSQSGTVYGNINVNINKNTNTDNSNNIMLLEKTTSTESSSTSSSQSVQAQSSNEVYGDFNGDGFDDLAIGVPGETLGSISAAGAVEVIYGSSSGLSATSAHADQFWTQDSTDIVNQAETGDMFGRSLVIGDFNADGFDDLVVGVPVEDLGSSINAGAVHVIYGSSSGLSATSAHADQFWTQDSTDIDDIAEPGDLFGSSLTTGDFNADGKDDLAIGAPGEILGTIISAGAVEVIYGSSTGLSATSAHADQFWTQDSTNIDDIAEFNDQFGFSLTAGDFNGDGKDDLAIGAPFENIGSILDAGGAEVIYGSSSGLSATLAHADQFWSQDSTDIGGSAEPTDQFGGSLATGDFNADGKDDLAIGLPGEDIGIITDVGGVQIIYGSSTGLSATLAHGNQFWIQDSPDIFDISELGDQFGFSLTTADFNADGKDDLAIGVRAEDLGSVINVGGVEVIYGSSNGLSATLAHADQFWTQENVDIDDSAEASDQFGEFLATGDFNADGKDDLAIGVLGEDLGSISGAGAVEVIYGSSSGLSATLAHADQFWTQDSTNIDNQAEQSDFFGFGLA